MKEKLQGVVVSLGIFFIGLFLLLWAEKVTNLVSIVFGTLLIIYGGFGLISYYKDKEKNSSSVIISSILLIAGLVLVIRPSIISEIISFVAGFFIVITSLVKLKNVLDNKTSPNYSKGLFLSIAGIVIGLLCIIGKLLIPNIILRFVGVMIMFYSMVNIMSIFLITKIKK